MKKSNNKIVGLESEVHGYKGFRYNLKCANDLSFRPLTVEDPNPVMAFDKPIPGRQGIHIAVNPLVVLGMYPPDDTYYFSKQPRYAQVIGYQVNTRKTQYCSAPCAACKSITRDNHTMGIVEYTQHIIARASQNNAEVCRMGMTTKAKSENEHTETNEACAGLVMHVAPHDLVAITYGDYSLCMCKEDVGYHMDVVITMGYASLAAMLNKRTAWSTRRALAFGPNSVAYCASQDGFVYAGSTRSAAIAKGVRTIAVANQETSAVYLIGNNCFGFTRGDAKVTGKNGTIVVTERAGMVCCRKFTNVIFQMPDGQWEILVCGLGTFEPYKYYSWKDLVQMVKDSHKRSHK
jgi:hypothetical protein